MRFALQMWCLMRPPPTMTMPVCLAFIAILLIVRRSDKRNFMKAFQTLLLGNKWDTLKNVYNKTRISKRVKKHHVSQGSVSEGGTEYWYLIFCSPVVNGRLVIDFISQSMNNLWWGPDLSLREHRAKVTYFLGSHLAFLPILFALWAFHQGLAWPSFQTSHNCHWAQASFRCD